MTAVRKRVAVLILSTGSGFAQQTANTLTFEVASIRPSPPDASGALIRPLGGGGLRMTGATLKNVIAYAYGVREFLVSGGPGGLGPNGSISRGGWEVRPGRRIRPKMSSATGSSEYGTF